MASDGKMVAIAPPGGENMVRYSEDMSSASWAKDATTIGRDSTGIAITGRTRSRLTIVTGPAAPDVAPDEVIVNGRRYVPAEEG